MTEARGKVGAIIVAAGHGQRMGGMDKVWAPLAGQPLLARVVDVFQNCLLVDQVVIVLGRGNLEQGRRLARERGWTKVTAVCRGGLRRQDSVREGLNRLSGCDWVVVHDGARPLVTADLIERGVESAQASGAATAAMPVKDTIKIVSRGGFVQETPSRHSLWTAQTPQVFRYDLLVEAHLQPNEEVTDDAALAEQMGHRVRVYMGSHQNIKVTTPEDLAVAEVILRNREQHHKPSP